jgi:hypothetical protein
MCDKGDIMTTCIILIDCALLAVRSSKTRVVVVVLDGT